jgi:hypothetical protein
MPKIKWLIPTMANKIRANFQIIGLVRLNA